MRVDLSDCDRRQVDAYTALASSSPAGGASLTSCTLTLFTQCRSLVEVKFSPSKTCKGERKKGWACEASDTWVVKWG